MTAVLPAEKEEVPTTKRKSSMSKKEVSVALFKVLSPAILYDGCEASMDTVTETALLRVGVAARRIFSRPAAIAPSPVTAFGDGYALLRSAEEPQQIAATHPLHTNSLPLTVKWYRDCFDDVLSRYRAAHESGTPVTAKDLDDSMLLLNTATWVLTKLGAVCIVAPDSGHPWQVEPVDPALLRCLERDTVEEVVIERALVEGAYATGPAVEELFSDPAQITEMIIRTNHTHCQLRCRMPLGDAQAIGVRLRWVTCRIRIKNGGVPEIIGKAVFE